LQRPGWPWSRGDALLARADLLATRALIIDGEPDAVWPWIAQIGQGLGGFYSYDSLENLLGCHIHSAEQVVAEWQDVTVGAAVNLAPEVSLTVALVEPQRAMVLRGGIPMGSVPAPYDFTWAFVLRPCGGGSTRMIVRERYGYLSRWAPLLVEPVQLISTLMTQRMLRGVRDRAQRIAPRRSEAVVGGV
jgi:hypothetical protein